MNLLLTGGAGFIGSHVLDILQTRDDIKVTVLDNLSSGKREFVPEKVQFVQEDIRSKNIETIFAQGHFDAVIHLAAQTLVPYSIEHPQEDADENIMGFLNVMENCRKYAIKHIVFSSSAAVYGDNSALPLKENEQLKPTSFYGLTKAMTESYMRIYHELCGINAVVLRFANVYGERQGNGGEGGVVSIFAKAITHNQAINVYGDGEQTRDFVYVKDIATALVQALEVPGFKVCNVSTNTEVSVNELITNFEALAGRKLQVNYLPVREGDIYRSVLSNRVLKYDLGLTPKYTLQEGLANTYAYFKHLEGE